MRTRNLGAAVVVGLLAAGGVVGVASPAAAAVSGLEVVRASSSSGAGDAAGVFVECPPGKVVVGVGFETRFGEGHVAVTEARPNGRPGGPPTSVVVTAREIDPFPRSWTVFGYATCADPLPGLVKVSTFLAAASDSYRGALVRCPAGKQLVGTGFETRYTNGQVIVDDFIVGNSGGVPTMLYLGAYEEEPYLPNWTMAVHAICADPVPGLERVSATRVGTGRLSPLVACPIGKVPLGGGFDIHSAPANAHQTLLAPVGTREVIGMAEEEDPVGHDWGVTTYLICADR